MKVLYKTFPDGFLTGVVPKSCLPSPPPPVGGHRKLSRSSIDIVPTTTSTDTVLKDSFSNDGIFHYLLYNMKIKL